MFWSGETLAASLPNLIDPPNKDNIDCSAYRLSIGSEVYISPSDQSVEKKSATVRRYDVGQWFAIPPGQFAFLITAETVHVPTDAIAFISIRAKVKFRGLVNVSGFHVDPGYRGQLTFSVFNAGPVPVQLKCGEQIFLIWYASLDRRTRMGKVNPAASGMAGGVIMGVAGELQSLEGLSARIHRLERMYERYAVFIPTAAAIIAAFIITYVFSPAKDAVSDRQPTYSTSESIGGTVNVDSSELFTTKTVPRGGFYEFVGPGGVGYLIEPNVVQNGASKTPQEGRGRQ